MKRLIGVAIAALALTFTGAANAAVIFQTTGQSESYSSPKIALPGPGSYSIKLTTSAPVWFSYSGGYTRHWDIFIAPPPKPHSEYVEGNDDEMYDGDGGFGTGGTWTLIIPETTFSYFISDSNYEGFGIPIGTSMYEEVRSENLMVELFAESDLGDTFTYSILITSLSAVPEPATWAMMIVGFGAAGSMVRRRRTGVTA